MTKMGLAGARTCAANVLSVPGSPAVSLRVRATGFGNGSAFIKAEPLHVPLRGAFRVLRDRGERVHSVHITVGHGATAAADSPPQLAFAYLDAAGTLLTVEENDIKVRRTNFCCNTTFSGLPSIWRAMLREDGMLSANMPQRPMLAADLWRGGRHTWGWVDIPCPASALHQKAAGRAAHPSARLQAECDRQALISCASQQSDL